MKRPIVFGVLLYAVMILSTSLDEPSAGATPSLAPLRHEARVDKGLSILLMLGMLYGVWRVVEARRKP
jgi:hypothetical protein